MLESEHALTDDAVFTAFGAYTVGEPLTTSEVAVAVAAPVPATATALQRLVARGLLGTRTVGTDLRLWWLLDEGSRPAGAPPTADTGEDHVVVVRLRSAELGAAFLALSPGIQMDLDGVVELDDGTVLQYLTVSGAPAREVLEMLRGYPHVIRVDLVSRHDGEFRIEAHTTPGSLGQLFRSFGGTTRTAFMEDGAFVIVGELPTDVDVAELATAAAALYPDIELTDVSPALTPRLFSALVREALTDRQWAVLLAAHYGGYFRQPRERSGTELAASLGITRQTFHDHLRKAHGVVHGTLLEPPR